MDKNPGLYLELAEAYRQAARVDEKIAMWFRTQNDDTGESIYTESDIVCMEVAAIYEKMAKLEN